MFNGRMLVFDYPGKKVGTTRIYSDAFYYLPKDDITKNNKVEMESDKFNQIFRVYAEDPHDAFYLLTPHFMETYPFCIYSFSNYKGNYGHFQQYGFFLKKTTSFQSMLLFYKIRLT